jgi:hypothetical protein
MGEYDVLVKQSAGTAEPYLGSADLDTDGVTNAEEYANVLACGGSLADFVAAAQDPDVDGTCVMSPPSCNAGTRRDAAPGAGWPAEYLPLLALGCVLIGVSRRNARMHLR